MFVSEFKPEVGRYRSAVDPVNEVLIPGVQCFENMCEAGVHIKKNFGF